jgi:hypothetical protein
LTSDFTNIALGSIESNIPKESTRSPAVLSNSENDRS